MQNKKLTFVNVGLGVWLLLSSLLWRRGGPTFVNLWVTGIIVIVTALLAMRMPRLRFVSVAAGVWLIASMFAFPDYSSPIVWNNVFVGAAIALVSLVGPEQADMFAS